jgi:uncharacterized repeat protein (TIGR03803 family)
MLMSALLLCGVRTAAAQSYTFIELYAFNATGDLSDGGWPEASLARDNEGNLYGTTFFGGLGTGCDINYLGCGVVFKVDPSGAETVLHAFSGPTDGWNPTARLIIDPFGNLYGTTQFGGGYGYGTVFKIDTANNYTILHSFQRGSDGANPNASLVQDTSENLYGTTRYGGRGCSGQGCGTVFEISASGQETILHRFADGADGASPLGGVTLDSSGNIYGTTWAGGIFNYGTIFEIDTTGTETVLHHFTAGSDGSNPLGGMTFDNSGNLYGTASGAGTSHIGTIFMISAAGEYSTLYTFNGSDGAYPYSHLILDSDGNLYGTASQGGTTGNGSVFEISGNALTVWYDFAGTTGATGDGAFPMGGLVMDSDGNLYGTAAQQGANGWGSVFELQLTGQ